MNSGRAFYAGLLEALTQVMGTAKGYLYDHGPRVAHLARLIGRELGLSERDLAELTFGSVLCDTGMIGLAEDAWENPVAKLDGRSRARVKLHPIRSETAVAAIPHLEGVASLVRNHHEWWDGSGYPDGLIGEEIPRGARILRLADTVAALGEARPQRPPLTEAETRRMVEEGRGVEFGPDVVAAFLGLFDQGRLPEMGYCLKSTAHYMLWSWRFRLLSSVAAWTIPVRGWSWTSSSPTMRHAWSTWRVCAGRKGLCAWAVAGWERSGEHRGGVSSAHTVEGRPRCWREPCSTARARPCVCGFSLPGSSRARNTEPMLSGSSACSDWEATRQRGSGSTSSAGPWSDRIATS